MGRNNEQEKTTMPAEQFGELDAGLMAMFRTCVERQENYAQTRIAGAKVAEAVMTLHRDFKPGAKASG